MKSKKFLFGNLGGILATLAVLTTLNVLILSTFRADITIYLGGSGLADNGTSEGTAFEDGLKVARQIEDEGIVLMKNENSALPLKGEGDIKVNVFGYNTLNLFYGGSGSGASSVENPDTYLTSYADNGLAYNQDIIKLMEDNASSVDADIGNPLAGSFYPAIPELTVDKYEANLTSYKNYSSIAIVNIGRSAGEGQDLPSGKPGEFKDHSGSGTEVDYLCLSKNEEDLIKMCAENFETVIVCINAANPLNLKILDDEGVDAALWIGHPGSYAFSEIGKVLRGTVNPSGRLVDTYAYDNIEQPSSFNAGAYYTHTFTNSNNYYVDYSEGIYVGYRYYETKYQGDETAYKKSVQFPFGYGLSYTDFTWTVTKEDIDLEEQKITIEVDVENTGDLAGKEVVQLYYTAPYNNGGIEKSYVTLGDFAKTPLIEPHTSKSVKLELNFSDMASYDYDDANADGHKGYELEKGEYELKLQSDAHTLKLDPIEFNLQEQINFDKSSTDYPIENRFEDAMYKDETKLITRADNFTSNLPTEVKPADRAANEEVLAILNNTSGFGDDDPEVAEIVTGTITHEMDKEKRDENGEIVLDENGEIVYETTVDDYGNETIAKRGLYLSDMVGLDYNDELWNDLLNQLTVEEMNDLINLGGYQTNAVASVNKSLNRDLDGPQGFNFSNVSLEALEAVSYPSEIVLASTFNKELAFDEGSAFGKEANEMGITGVYAPAVNIHRFAYGGRNYEYYSEDPLLSGFMGANFVLGANSHGLNCFVKHFALNDQEHQRYGLSTFADEQTIREIYLKPFKMCVELGKTRCIMSSFNRIGATWTGANYNLLTEVLRNEWGFKGMVLTDYYMSFYSWMNVNQGLRAGNDCWLTGLPMFRSNADLTSNASKQYARQACKNILYAVANAKATAVTLNENWLNWFIPVDVVLFALVGLWLFLVLWTYYKGEKKSEQEEK